jgi:hypothetical protein
MGQAISIDSKYCIEVPEALCVEYTVKRTSGEMDGGWRIPSEFYMSRVELTFPSASKHAQTETKHWRIFMHNGKTTPEEIRYAWRRVNSVYPTELEGDEDAILTWQSNVERLFDTLEEARIAEGGKTPESELKEIDISIGDGFRRIQKEDDERVAGYEKELI